jgi:hypothetical protein
VRISVECGGFDDAADACRTANQTIALLAESLSGKLAGFGAMAGDDATSADFATSYDTTAAEAVGSLAGLTHAFIGLGRLLSSTGANHAHAEAAAAQVVAYSGRGLTDDAFVRVFLAVPPSSLGADEPSFGVVDRWILDQVEGFVWPGADVGLLRDAAHAWHRASSGVALLADQVDVARAMVERQRSPEIPAVLASLADVRRLVSDVAAELAALGDACEEYAAAVEDTHARTRALLAEIGQMVVEGAVISVVVGGLTGGLGGTATAAAAAARIRAQAPRFHALIVALRATIATGSARMRTARESLRGLRARLDRYGKVAVRDERGEMRLPGGLGGRGAHRLFNDRQLQKKFKHATDFGVKGDFNPAAARAFRDALEAFIEREATLVKAGTMRGQSGEITFHLDLTSRRCVAVDNTGNFISGWKLSPKQLQELLERGHLGGG